MATGTHEIHFRSPAGAGPGSLSPEGFYDDSFDHDVVADAVLAPLGPDGDGRYLPGLFDYRTDSTAEETWRQAPGSAVSLFDGVFLLRPELRDFRDMSVYLHVAPEVALVRALVRDLELFGSADVIEERYGKRHFPGQEIYRTEARPLEAAELVLDMNDPLRPGILKRDKAVGR